MTSTKGANNVVAILWEYERCSRQQVNFDKSLVYFSLNVSHGMRAIVGGVLGVHSTTDPENYIGLPMVVGSNKKRAFWAIKNLFLGKIGSWYNRCLSQGGKVSLKEGDSLVFLGGLVCFERGQRARVSESLEVLWKQG